MGYRERKRVNERKRERERESGGSMVFQFSSTEDRLLSKHFI